MTRALGAALRGMWAQSWRLFLANAALSVGVLPFLVAALWAPLALVGAALVAGPLAMALMHCAVELVREDDLSLRCWPAGLRAALAARPRARRPRCALVVAAGVLAIDTYAGAGQDGPGGVVLYVLLAFGVYQLALWPLAVAEQRRAAADGGAGRRRRRPPRAAAGDAARASPCCSSTPSARRRR